MRNLFERNHASGFALELRPLCPRIGVLLGAAVCFTFFSFAADSGAPHAPCRIQPATFDGWKAEELTNDWVQLTIVPQLGGRLMQVQFGEHRYLFVNPHYEGKYFPPADSMKQREWINYGGDKVWPLPEGHGEGYWPGPISDPLDDGEYQLSAVSRGSSCALRLQGPADPATGLQYSREISIDSDSPQISFHAVMKNAAEHPIRWSMQSVTQYDTADSRNPDTYNHDFWAFAPVNSRSAYIDGYRVRNGLADDPSYAVHDRLFTLHWLYLENEVWLDSDVGWIGVVDDSTKYGMIETFRYFAGAEYPGKASVIFYKNGAALELDGSGQPMLRSNNPQAAPYYMEAEINSPMRQLEPGASYALDTRWFPVRTGKGFRAVTAAGVIECPLVASLTANRLQLSASFGVFFAGRLNAHIFDPNGVESGVIELQYVDPLQSVELNRTISVPPGAGRVSIHLNDQQGLDRGSLGEAKIAEARKDL